MTDASGGTAQETERQVPLRVILKPLRDPLRKDIHLVVLTILAGWGKFILPLAIPLLIGRVFDHILDPARRGDPALQGELWLHIGLMLGCTTLVAIATYYRHTWGQRLSAQLQHRLRKKLFHHIQRLSLAFFQRHHAGALGSRVSSDIAHSSVVVEKGIVQVALDGVAFLVMAGILVWMNAWLATIVAAMVFANAYVLHRFGWPIRMQRKSIQERQSQVTGRAAEIFAGISVVKAYAGEAHSRRAFTEQSSAVRDLQVATSQMQGRFQSVTNSLLRLCEVLVVAVGAWVIITHPESLTKGQLIAFMLYVANVNGSVQRLTEGMLQLQEGLAALERIHDVLTVLPAPADHPQAVKPPIRGDVGFERVTFGYRPDEPVIRDFSFSFKAGRSYALVGPSGGGKSSLMQLLLRFYDPQEGRIVVDGHDLRAIDQGHYRAHIAAVLQDPIIFSGSVADNIGFASDGGMAEIEAAARKAQAHEFLSGLPEGYHSRLGERGVSLSGGQRQRVAIARALMRDPRILVLDEATSALDTMTERSIQQVVDDLRGTRTVIVIAHRLSTIRNVDEILVLERGRLVEHGGFEELLAKGGVFTQLAARQTEHAA